MVMFIRVSLVYYVSIVMELGSRSNRFRGKKWLTRWTWDPTNEEAIYEGFLNVLKRRFRDITMQLRIKATKLAYEAREKINPSVPNQFRIIRKYPPESIPINIWRDMCSVSKLTH
ncbi:hypothetical protein HanPI659440_Chr08g0299431 [Helianthus annuus]|nr:hypothetical protein HanPI659440_Chr08g0299431 [Helianthus annuus]